MVILRVFKGAYYYTQYIADLMKQISACLPDRTAPPWLFNSNKDQSQTLIAFYKMNSCWCNKT